ncbi:MAG: hypothetical protein QM775_11260 [Pirellulales bacterium]
MRDIALPGLVNDTSVGGGGRYLLLSLNSLQKVGVFDVRDGKIKKYVNIDSDDFLVAGGASKFVVVDRANHKLQAWKFDALDQPAEQAKIDMSGRKQILSAAMGLASEGPLALAFQDDGTRGIRSTAELFALDGLAPIAGVRELFASAFRNASSSSEVRFNLWASPDGTMFQVVSRARSFRAYVSNGLVTGTNDVSISPTYDPTGEYQPHYDGRTYSMRSQLLAADGVLHTVNSPNIGGTGVITPALPGQYWLFTGRSNNSNPTFSRNSTLAVGFHVGGVGTPLAVLRLQASNQQVTTTGGGKVLPESKHVFYDAREKMLVVISRFAPEIAVKKFDIDAAVANSSESILHVVSDPPITFVPEQKYEYVIQAISNRGGVTYRVESGPAGMNVSPEGRVEWTAPADAPALQTAIVVVGDKGGNQIFHNIKLKRGHVPVPEVSGVGADAVVPDVARLAVRLPAPASDVIVGGAGRYLLAVIPSKRQIAVVDVKERKLLKLIPADGDQVKIAAGMTRFVVYNGKGMLSRWNFSKLERELTLPLAKEIESLCMGCASEGPVLIGERANGSLKSVFLDLSTLKPTKLQTWSSQYGREYDNMEEHCAASAGGQMFTSWRRGSTPLGVCSMVVRGDKVIIYYRHDSAGPLTPSPDGSLVYTLLAPSIAAAGPTFPTRADYRHAWNCLRPQAVTI